MEVLRGDRLALEEKQRYCFRGVSWSVWWLCWRGFDASTWLVFLFALMIEFCWFCTIFVYVVVRGFDFGFLSCLWFRYLDFMGFGGSPLWGVSLVCLSDFVFDVWMFFWVVPRIYNTSV
jgi:hypothetical protein